MPDEVVLRLGVETLDPDLQDAVAQNTRGIAAVEAVARAAGIPAERVATDHLGLEPMTASREVNGLYVLETYGYRVRRGLTVTLRFDEATGFEVFDALLRDAVGAGATHVHGVDFRTTELRRHRDAARAQAVRAAREKAEALAAELGETVGASLSISERGQWGYGSGWGASYGAGALQNVSVSAGESGPAAPGRIAVRSSVDVSFGLGD